MSDRVFVCEDYHNFYVIHAPGEKEAWDSVRAFITPDWEVIPVINDHGGMQEVGLGRELETVPQDVKKTYSYIEYEPPRYTRYQTGGDLYQKPLDPTLAEPLPAAPEGEKDVGWYIVEQLTKMGYREVAEDHEARIVWGEKKYGQRLRTNNGRNMLLDAYQEVLDFLSYSAGAILEGDLECQPLFLAASEMAANVRKLITRKKNAENVV